MKRKNLSVLAFFFLFSIPGATVIGQQKIPSELSEESKACFSLPGEERFLFSKTVNNGVQIYEDKGTIQWCSPDTILTYKADEVFEKYIYTLDERGNALCTEYLNYSNGTWIPVQKITAYYNQWDKIDSTINFYYQKDRYVPSNRKISTYDGRGNHVSLLNQTYDQSTGTFYDENRYTYSYTEKDQVKYTLKEQPLTNGEWENLEQWNYSYDAEGNQTEYLYDLFRNGRWNPFRHIFNTYSKGLLSEQTCKSIDANGIFNNSYRQFYQYDEKGNDTNYLYQVYDSTGKWANAVKWSKTFTETGKISTYISYIDDFGKWLEQNKEVYTYNEKDLLAQMEIFRSESYSWGKTADYHYTYDDNGYLKSYQREGLRFDEWVVEKYEYELDEDGNHTLGQCFRQQNENWNPVVLYDLELHYNHQTASFRASNTPLHKIEISFARGEKSEIVVPPVANSSAPKDLDVNIYPNPASHVLYVEIPQNSPSEIFLIDLSGRILFKTTSNGGTLELPVESLAGKGQALLHIRQDNTTVTRKIILL